MIPYGKQTISQGDIDAVVAVLKSDWLTQGPAIPQFEESMQVYCQVPHAVAVSNATAALHLACLAADLGPGDWLWTSSNSFVASANCGLYCGAKVDFVDIDPRTYNLDVSALKVKLEKAAEENCLPKVVIPVHFSGQACEMSAIFDLAKQYKFTIIEDASHAVGGDYLGEKIGNCRYSDMTVFSFHPVKIITTGEGGLITTKNSQIAERLKRLRTHGITRNASEMSGLSHGDWFYQQIELGFNYRMTDLQAALGASQLKRLDEFIEKRRRVARVYQQALARLPLILPYQHADTNSAWHLFVIQVDSAKTSMTRKEVFDYLRKQGVGVNVHYIPIHTQPYYQNIGFKTQDFPKTLHYYERAISLPIYFSFSQAEQNFVIQTLTSVFE